MKAVGSFLWKIFVLATPPPAGTMPGLPARDYQRAALFYPSLAAFSLSHIPKQTPMSATISMRLTIIGTCCLEHCQTTHGSFMDPVRKIWLLSLPSPSYLGLGACVSNAWIPRAKSVPTNWLHSGRERHVHVRCDAYCAEECIYTTTRPSRSAKYRRIASSSCSTTRCAT